MVGTFSDGRGVADGPAADLEIRALSGNFRLQAGRVDATVSRPLRINTRPAARFIHITEGHLLMIQNTFSRRTLLKRSAMTAAAVGISQISARSYSNIIGANDDIRIAVVGFNGRGKNHIDSYLKLQGVRIVALCDVDEAVLNKEYNRL